MVDLRSKSVTGGDGCAAARSYPGAAGLSDLDFERPLVALVNTWSSANTANTVQHAPRRPCRAQLPRRAQSGCSAPIDSTQSLSQTASRWGPRKICRPRHFRIAGRRHACRPFLCPAPYKFNVGRTVVEKRRYDELTRAAGARSRPLSFR